jgi:hypothetical protein
MHILGQMVGSPHGSRRPVRLATCRENLSGLRPVDPQLRPHDWVHHTGEGEAGGVGAVPPASQRSSVNVCRYYHAGANSLRLQRFGSSCSHLSDWHEPDTDPSSDIAGDFSTMLRVNSVLEHRCWSPEGAVLRRRPSRAGVVTAAHLGPSGGGDLRG